MNAQFHVSICGGGIGGLTLALVLGKYGARRLSVEIFEAGPTITTIGAGIGLVGRTMDIMKELGLYDKIAKMTIAPPRENTGPTFNKSDQQDGHRWFSKSLKRGTMMVHRRDMVECLLQQVSGSCEIHTSKRLTSYDADTENGKITLHFSDGSSSVTDVLVGADGIRSVTRKTMYQELASRAQDEDSRNGLLACIDPVWTGGLVYRSLVPAAKLQKEFPNVELPTGLTMYLGRKKHIVAYPISQGRLINVVIFLHDQNAFGTPFEGRWVVDVSEKEVREHFEDWDIRARALVKCVERPSRWASHVLRPLPYYVDGRVVLLGDAAHATEPHLGAGAGQAMEDAFVLGRLLAHELTHLGNVADALKVYEQVRWPRANCILQWSQDVGRCYSFQRVSADGSVPPRGSPEELDFVRKSIEDLWECQNESAWEWGDAEKRWKRKCGTGSRL